MKTESILVRGVNWLGDAVMSTPALQRLREARPDAAITLLTPEKLRELWTDHPAINRVLTFSPGEMVFSLGRRLRAESFATALILPNSPRSAIESWLARIPRRIGAARPWRSWFLTEALPARAAESPMVKRSAQETRLLIETGIAIRQPAPPPGAHHLHQYLHLTSALGASLEPCAPVLKVADAAVSAVAEKFEAQPAATRGRPLIGINPGAEYGPAKRWPKERFIEAAVGFARLQPADWWIFGGPAERTLAEEIASGIRRGAGAGAKVECLAGRTSLGELCAALKCVNVLLTNDSGPMHVAAAVGTPVIALYGSTSPELTGPGLPGDPRHQLLREPPACAPCFQRECPIDYRCLSALTVERVVTALAKAVAISANTG